MNRQKTNRRGLSYRVTTAAALSLLLVGPAAPADLAPDYADVVLEPETDRLVRRLDDPDFHIRQSAFDDLLHPAIGQEQLYVALSQGGLSAEQHHRLLTAVRTRLLRRQRGALGISMARRSAISAEIRGIEIGELLPGLPAERILRVGDWITHVDGQAIGDTRELQTAIQMKEPGDEVKLTVVRIRIDEQGNTIFDDQEKPLRDTIDLAVPLGSADHLSSSTSPLTPQSPVALARLGEADEAWRRFAPGARPIEVKITGGEPISDDEVARHPMIMRLVSQCRALSHLGLRPPRKMVDQWQAGRLKLEAELARLDLTPRVRELTRRVLERYVAITGDMPESD